MKNILMVCSTFYPDNNPRAVQCSELFKEFCKRGYKVDLCITPQRKFYVCSDAKRLLEKKGTGEKTFVGDKTGVKKWLSSLICYFIGQKGFFTYYPWLKNTIKVDHYNVVLAVAAPFYNIVLTARMLKKTNTKAICDNGDPFYNPKLHSLFVKNIQERAFSRFDYICFPVEKARVYYQKYAAPNKLRVIPQGRDMESVDIKIFEKNKVPTFAFAGCFFIDIRNPETFFQMLLEVDVDYKFVLYTETVGEVYDKIIRKYQRLLSDRLEVHAFLPRRECIYELSGMDFLVNFENLSQVQSPSKLIDYTITKRPIYSVRQDNINKSIFLDFLSGNYEKQTRIDISQYDIKVVAQKYIDLFEE